MSFTIAGDTGTGEESLYVMRSGTVNQCSLNFFEVLNFGGDGDGGRSSYYFDHKIDLRWRPLPRPPIDDGRFGSSTLLDGGRIICVSSWFDGSAVGTFCFDTVSCEWWHAGDWQLPFHDTAEFIPELETWVGLSPDHPHHLCAADLSGIAMAPREERTLQHVWEDFNPPPTVETSLVLNKRFPGIVHTTKVEWSAQQLHLVNLGSGRFCTAKVFTLQCRGDSITQLLR
ncbi:hypothetical protein BAE44_0002163 [Dichanthelium oligosanthes]|uniref:DUF1618 domain-containing protein n=1 Tax=Dichanthelium oligosanthes TaxID=888268 RepID=A0A1E5WHE4_9POAL|nr:hypothetical protein BAE44_0002163 [Dichanthelium oligosanthes]